MCFNCWSNVLYTVYDVKEKGESEGLWPDVMQRHCYVINVSALSQSSLKTRWTSIKEIHQHWSSFGSQAPCSSLLTFSLIKDMMNCIDPGGEMQRNLSKNSCAFQKQHSIHQTVTLLLLHKQTHQHHTQFSHTQPNRCHHHHKHWCPCKRYDSIRITK